MAALAYSRASLEPRPPTTPTSRCCNSLQHRPALQPCTTRYCLPPNAYDVLCTVCSLSSQTYSPCPVISGLQPMSTCTCAHSLTCTCERAVALHASRRARLHDYMHKRTSCGMHPYRMRHMKNDTKHDNSARTRVQVFAGEPGIVCGGGFILAGCC